MGKVSKEDIPMESAFMGIFWNYIKFYWIPEDSDSYWTEVTTGIDRTIKYMQNEAQKSGKQIDTDFCESLMLGYVNYLERKYRKNKKKGGEKT